MTAPITRSGIDELNRRIKQTKRQYERDPEPDKIANPLEDRLKVLLRNFFNEAPNQSFILEVERNIREAEKRRLAGDVFEPIDDFFVSKLDLNDAEKLSLNIRANFLNEYNQKVDRAKQELADIYTRDYSVQLQNLGSENQLVDQRLTGFLTAQTILFAALALVGNKDTDLIVLDILKEQLPFVGILASVVTLYVNVISLNSSATLEKQIPLHLRNRIGSFLTLREDELDDIYKKPKKFFSWVIRVPIGKTLLPPISIPIIFGIAWWKISCSL